jgi:hypothetical protein
LESLEVLFTALLFGSTATANSVSVSTKPSADLALKLTSRKGSTLKSQDVVSKSGQPLGDRLSVKGQDVLGLTLWNNLPVTLRFLRQHELTVSAVQHLRACVS